MLQAPCASSSSASTFSALKVGRSQSKRGQDFPTDRLKYYILPKSKFKSMRASTGSKTFEVYILAAGYSREKAESKVPGIGSMAGMVRGTACIVLSVLDWQDSCKSFND